MQGLDIPEERKKQIIESRLRTEISRGVQTIQYQVVTLMTTNGQAPFITVFMYLGEAKNEQEKKTSQLSSRKPSVSGTRVLKMRMASGLPPLFQS